MFYFVFLDAQFIMVMLLSMKQDSLRAARETRFWKFHIVFKWTV